VVVGRSGGAQEGHSAAFTGNLLEPKGFLVEVD
jgi:hypothetical protein